MFKRAGSWIRLAVVAILSSALAALSFSQVSLATSPPSSASTSYYVGTSWTTTSAYNQGCSASPGSGVGMYIFIDFGRQVYSSGWGVYPVGTSTFESDSWVSSIAQNFIDGYSACNTTTAHIVIGTNNDEPNFSTNDCTNFSPCENDWTEAGIDWNGLVGGLTQDQYTTIWSGNDFETWGGNCSTSVCSGANAETWLSNLSSSLLNMNYGDDGAAISSTWSQTQEYNVSWGYSNAEVAPEIYCGGQVTDWVNTFTANNDTLYFASTTSENGAYWGSACVGSSYYTYTFTNGWNALYNGLPSGYQYDLASDAIVI